MRPFYPRLTCQWLCCALFFFALCQQSKKQKRSSSSKRKQEKERDKKKHKKQKKNKDKDKKRKKLKAADSSDEEGGGKARQKLTHTEVRWQAGCKGVMYSPKEQQGLFGCNSDLRCSCIDHGYAGGGMDYPAGKYFGRSASAWLLPRILNIFLFLLLTRHGWRSCSAQDFAKHGYIRESDAAAKHNEFMLWATEAKGVNIELLGKGEEKELFKEYMEDYNTGTLQHK